VKLVGLGSSAQELLTAMSTQLVTLLGAANVPKAQYVAAGEVPWDGESLIVSMGSIGTGQPGIAIAQSLISPSQIETYVTLYVELIRAVSTYGYGSGVKGIPQPAQMGKEGLQALNDAGALVSAAIAVKAASTLVTLGAGFAIGPCVPIGPDGGLAAMRLELALSIDGA
jgi:hypothetical protein